MQKNENENNPPFELLHPDSAGLPKKTEFSANSVVYLTMTLVAFVMRLAKFRKNSLKLIYLQIKKF